MIVTERTMVGDPCGGSFPGTKTTATRGGTARGRGGMGGGHRHLLDFPRREYEGITLHEQVLILSISPCCRRTHRPAEPSSPWPRMPAQIVEWLTTARCAEDL